ncbi:hypothetical protein FDH86_gp082 [Arthrobacter phage Tank]|uniref:Uncharacterized protein n=2 Tax=Tankvirus tank TaxID=1982567 RepID=A0A0U3TND4_9CAUD|nr:hypothetical protein FDH86_gp082 [Arthrobacter phage Tank]ALY10617.1 hypothetical protein TANK_82 [Arthrobacter phage Tank]ALY10866.1 hypothetical protein WILDE_84 [Arthrobacter phage Wilde]
MNIKRDETTVLIPNEVASTESITQYGVRWPDGTISWHVAKEVDTTRNNQVWVSDLIEDSGIREVSSLSKQNWDKMLDLRSQQAKIDYDTYADMHTFLKRTLVVAVTAAEVAK